MKSNPQHRRQVNKQALKHKTKEAVQWRCSVIHRERSFFFFFFNFLCFYFLPVQQVVCGPQCGFSGDKTQASKLRQVKQVTLKTLHKSYQPLC